MDSFEKVLQRRSRILVHALIISGTLNIALMTIFIIFALKERKEVFLPTIQELPLKKTLLTNQEVLHGFLEMTYEELIHELYDETHIEEGQRRCDLALAFLGAYHHFDVERAFSGYPVEKRMMFLDHDNKIVFYPGLNGGRFEGIRRFAKTEAWPLTPEGLFREIKLRKDPPKSLKESFENTKEYFVVKRTFRRLPYVISEEDLFSLIMEGEWEEVKDLTDQIQKKSDERVFSFVSFLVPRMERGSQLAAYLLVLLERDYALKKLDDSQMEKLLALLTEKTPEIETFLSDVRSSLRSDYIQKIAGEPLTRPLRCHIVRPGDSLWKISRDYDVKVEVIQEMNNLKSENLKLGAELILPADTKTFPKG